MNTGLEQRVTRRTMELEAINKELEAFSYSVSHDLRAPLRSIDGFSNKILKDYGDRFDDQAKDYFNRIMNASRKMGTLIDDLLHLARLTRIEMRIETANMSEMAEAIVRELKESAPQRQAEINIRENMVVAADRNLMQIALQNLLGNAWKYSKNQELTKIEFAFYNENGRTIYYIKDNGVGFDMKYADKIFGAFQRLHSVAEFEGTGIGLATVQRIIRRHHGNIWAKSQPGQGTTFYFTLN
jgi:light-regulated signal transduction histidine kinase (bacteriophytochrome)